MYFSTYSFTGDSTDLAERFDRLLAGFPQDELILNVAVRTDTGLTVYDTCPDRAAFEGFSTGEEFAAALQANGLPTPVITPVGEIHRVIANTSVSA